MILAVWTLTFGRLEMPSLPRSRRSSSPGNSPSTWRRHAKPSRLIPTSTRGRPEYIEMERQDDLRRSAAGRACQGVATEGRERVALKSRGAENPASPQPTPRTGQWLSSPSAASSPGTGAKTTNATRSSPRTTTCWNCTVPDSLPRMGRTRPRKLRDRIILVAGQLPRGDGGDGLRSPSSPSLALC